jgi:hypothetical protein
MFTDLRVANGIMLSVALALSDVPLALFTVMVVGVEAETVNVPLLAPVENPAIVTAHPVCEVLPPPTIVPV